MLSLGLLLLAILCGLGLWAAWIEPRQVHTRRFRVAVANLETPLRAVVIGDLQPNVYHWPPERLGALFKRLQSDEKPDLVLWLGDYYNAPTDVSKPYLEARPSLHSWVAQRLPVMEEIAYEMSHLRGRLGNFSVLGNHDWAWSGSETARHLTENGITVLQDDVITLTDPDSGQHLQIIGYEDLTSGRHPDYDRVHAQCNPDLPQISLAHSPDTFPRAKGGPGLMFSGHTHGGQVCLPFLGPLVLPLHNRLYDYGWFVEGTRRLYVTSGMGTSLPPLRFMMPPEVVVLDLMPVENLEMKED